MRVLLVTSPNEKCGIREHSAMLYDAVMAAHPTGIIDVEWVSPSNDLGPYDIIHIDHHAALHAAWTPAVTDDLRCRGYKVVVTQHDTYEDVDIMEERKLYNFHDHVDALIVHEEVEGLTDQGYYNVYHWGQPVPELPLDTPDWPSPTGYLKPLNDPPVVGTVGFDFLWKGFEMLEKCAAEAGWRTRIFGGSENWMSRDALLKELRKCNATAFLYGTGNSGTSAAIRMGIAVRRPLIALTGCRQFRDLSDEQHVLWAKDSGYVVAMLKQLAESESLPWAAAGLVAELADRDSWSNAGRRYAALYQRLSQ